MAAAILPELGKTCAQKKKKKKNKQRNGGIIAQQTAGREAQDVSLQTVNAAIFDVCPLLAPLLGLGATGPSGVWNEEHGS